MGAFSLIVVINLLNRGSRMAASSLRISAEALAILLETRAVIAEVRDLRIAVPAELEEARAKADAAMNVLKICKDVISSKRIFTSTQQIRIAHIQPLLISAQKVAEIGDKLVALEPLSVSAILAAQANLPC